MINILMFIIVLVTLVFLAKIKKRKKPNPYLKDVVRQLDKNRL